MPEEWSKDRLLELSRAFQRNRILLTAAELDLFTKLTGKSQTVGELCRQEDWKPRGTTIILDALTAMGLLSKTADGHYSTKEELVGFLAEGSPDSVLPMLLHSVHLWESWSYLTEIVRTGKSPHAVGAAVRSDEDVEAFIGAMQVAARNTAETMAASIELGGYNRMLDLGGGPGTYTIAFLKKAPRMTATLFDLPRVIELARKRVTQAGLIDRVQLVAGDYDTDPLPDGHDLVWASAVIHSNSRDRNRELFKKAFDALTPGGTILIRDYFMDPTRTLPVDGAIFAMNMLAATTDGNCYTFEEVKEDLEGAGFRSVRIIVHGNRMDQVVSAVK